MYGVICASVGISVSARFSSCAACSFMASIILRLLVQPRPCCRGLKNLCSARNIRLHPPMNSSPQTKPARRSNNRICLFMFWSAPPTLTLRNSFRAQSALIARCREDFSGPRFLLRRNPLVVPLVGASNKGMPRCSEWPHVYTTLAQDVFDHSRDSLITEGAEFRFHLDSSHSELVNDQIPGLPWLMWHTPPSLVARCSAFGVSGAPITLPRTPSRTGFAYSPRAPIRPPAAVAKRSILTPPLRLGPKSRSMAFCPA